MKMEKTKKISELLYLSFDGQLSQDEQQRLEEALVRSPQLRRERERIVALRHTIATSGARSFRPFFAERVMHAITTAREVKNGLERFSESLQLAFRRVALAGVAAILLLLAYNFVTSGDLSIAGAFGMSQETLVEVLESPFDATVEDLL
jgi:anti-sigma factor RsiW